jgi:hypothetical protein
VRGSPPTPSRHSSPLVPFVNATPGTWDAPAYLLGCSTPQGLARVAKAGSGGPFFGLTLALSGGRTGEKANAETLASRQRRLSAAGGGEHDRGVPADGDRRSSQTRDCAAMLEIIAGYHPSDESCVERPVDDYLGVLTGELDGLRIGFVREHHVPDESDPALAGCFGKRSSWGRRQSTSRTSTTRR